jgi:ADP-heptose:LPS heptosyltransferase
VTGSVLALRALGLGDLLTAVPALRGLRLGRPGSEITLAAPAVLGPLVARIGAVDRLLAVPSAVDAPPGPPPWPGPPPDLAVNLHGRGPQSVAAMRRMAARRLWSYEVDGGPPWDDDEHEVARWCRLVAWYGCPADPGELRLGAWRGAGGPFVLHPGAADPRRRWPAGRFAWLARQLGRGGGRVVLTGDRRERSLAHRIAAAAGLPPRAVLAGRTDLVELADLVAGARVLVAGDTGVAHLASAYGTPSVLLFGPQPPTRWGPPADPRHRVLWHPVDGPPGPGVHPGLLRLPAEEVLAATLALVEATRGVPADR